MVNETETKPATKKCPHCQSEIPVKAKKCPNCQSDLRNWFNRHPILTILGVFILFIVAVSIIGSGMKKEGYIQSPNEPTKVGEVSQQEQPAQPEKPKIKIFSIGEQTKLGDYILTVNSIKTCVSDNEFIQPSSGNKFIIADITQENVGSIPKDYNLWYFKLQDNKDYSYTTAILSCKEPMFGFGTLQPTMKTRGYITFEIPQGNQPSKLIFTPDWWEMEQIIIEVK